MNTTTTTNPQAEQQETEHRETEHRETEPQETEYGYTDHWQPALEQPETQQNSYLERLEVVDLGVIAYSEALLIQEHIQKRIQLGLFPPYLLFCTHPPTITIGTSGDVANILSSPKELAERGIKVERSNRGGNVTYHGSGQLICYPLLDLRLLGKTDVNWYMRSLEAAVILTLQDLGIKATRSAGQTGVWIDGRKISSMGVRFRRWCSLHGIAVYLQDEPNFLTVKPCGLAVQTTSIAREKGAISRDQVKQQLAIHLQNTLTTDID